MEQEVGQQAEYQDPRIRDSRNTEVKQEMAAVHLRRAVEDLTEAGRTELCTHAAP
jgi:hypothetical protein